MTSPKLAPEPSLGGDTSSATGSQAPTVPPRAPRRPRDQPACLAARVTADCGLLGCLPRAQRPLLGDLAPWGPGSSGIWLLGDLAPRDLAPRGPGSLGTGLVTARRQARQMRREAELASVGECEHGVGFGYCTGDGAAGWKLRLQSSAQRAFQTAQRICTGSLGREGADTPSSQWRGAPGWVPCPGSHPRKG